MLKHCKLQPLKLHLVQFSLQTGLVGDGRGDMNDELTGLTEEEVSGTGSINKQKEMFDK